MITQFNDATLKSTAIDSFTLSIGDYSRLYCIRVTEAPIRYDCDCLTLYKGQYWRIVMIPAHNLTWQLDRYSSGLYGTALLQDIGVEMDLLLRSFADSVFRGKMDVVTEEEGDKS